MSYKIWLVYLAVISCVSIIVCVTDKIAAIKQKSRVSEKTLFLLSALGGALLMYITMRIIRHKTLHKRFMLGLPTIMLLQVLAFSFLQIYLDIPLIQ